jgi:hypothetical protein
MATIPSNQKILTSAPEVNTTYGGPASLQALNTWYTMEDIANTVRPYKVYTALLTQSGGDDTVGLNSGNLTIGVTYEIAYVGRENFDFTNVGAPNNNIGTKFVATGITPASWGTGGSIDDLLGYNTGAPVVTVLENTIGDIWFTYNSVGIYDINSNSLFTKDKTYLPSPNIDISSIIGSEKFLFSGFNSENILTLNNTDSSFTSNDNMGRGYLEIRVYN